MGSYELGMCEEVSWEGVGEVMKYLKRGKALGPDGILKASERLVLYIMNMGVSPVCYPPQGL